MNEGEEEDPHDDVTDWVGHLSKPSDPGPKYPSERVAGRSQLPDNRSKKPTKDA
jgi:hypothetical protein